MEIACPYCRRPIALGLSVTTVAHPGYTPLNRDELRNCSVREALVKIARANGGHLVTRDAVPILIEAGIFTDREHASSLFSPLCRAKAQFRKQRAGHYLLIS